MTFKHIKFNESFTMRSLEKTALEKGMVKADELVKEASNSVDLMPTSDLTHNIIKLCGGLRKAGLDSYANDLENKFIKYKTAENYNVSNEKGEDLIDAAHPQGSHQLKDVEGDSVIETILDQQLKHLEIVNKKPTGKLASNNEIINAVKVALAQTVADEKNARLRIGYLNTVNHVVNLLKQVDRTLESGLSIGDIFGEGTLSAKNSVVSAIERLEKLAKWASNERAVVNMDALKRAILDTKNALHFVPKEMTQHQDIAAQLVDLENQVVFLKSITSEDYTSVAHPVKTEEKETGLPEGQMSEWDQFTTLDSDLAAARAHLAEENNDMINSPPTTEEGMARAKKFIAQLNAVVKDLNKLKSSFKKVPVEEAFNSTYYFKGQGNQDGYLSVMNKVKAIYASYNRYWGVNKQW